jgi:hypothetical protein
MKRIGLFVSLILVLAWANARPVTMAASPICMAAMDTELPDATVQAVLKKASTLCNYSYERLLAGYAAGWVTIAQSGSGWVVTVCDSDGIGTMILIDNL